MTRVVFSLAIAVGLCALGFYMRERALLAEDAEARESFAMIAAAACVVSIVFSVAAFAALVIGD